MRIDKTLLDSLFICRANLLGTQFTLFDNGDNPKSNYENARKELVGIVYVSYQISWIYHLLNTHN